MGACLSANPVEVVLVSEIKSVLMQEIKDAIIKETREVILPHAIHLAQLTEDNLNKINLASNSNITNGQSNYISSTTV